VKGERAAARGPPLKLVSFDIDGTLTQVHGWQHIAEGLGKRTEYERTQGAFLRGERGEDEHLRALLALGEGERRSRVEGLLATTPRLTGIRSTVRSLHRAGLRVVLLTHNPTWVGRWYASRFGFDAWTGVEQPVVQGRLGPAPRFHLDKRITMGRMLCSFGIRPIEAAHVGDAGPDARVFPYLGTGVALNTNRRSVLRAADLFVCSQDLRDLLPFLSRAFKSRVPSWPSERGPPSDLQVEEKESYVRGKTVPA
jgi:phosphoserine phosphatase